MNMIDNNRICSSYCVRAVDRPLHEVYSIILANKFRPVNWLPFLFQKIDDTLPGHWLDRLPGALLTPDVDRRNRFAVEERAELLRVRLSLQKATYILPPSV